MKHCTLWIYFAMLAVWVSILPVSLRATTLIPPDFPQLVATSQQIIHGTVHSVRSDWTTQAGYRVIKSWVTIDLLERVKGDETSSQLVLEFLGGKIGDADMKVEGSPRFNEGDELVLFISGNGGEVCPLVGWGHGAYRVKSDAVSGDKRIARINGLPLASTADVAIPLVALAAIHPAVLAANAGATGLTLVDFKKAIRDEQSRK